MPKEFEPTEKQRELVRILAANGVPIGVMARNLGVTRPTFRKYFKKEQSEGREDVKAALGHTLIQIALGGSLGAIKYWLSTHGGPDWVPKEEVRHGGTEDGPPIAINTNARVTFFLPDNGRRSAGDVGSD